MIEVTDHGEHNLVEVHPDAMRTGTGRIVFNGSFNRVTIRSPVIQMGLCLVMEGASSVHIDSDANISNAFVYCRDRGFVEIGRNVGFNGAVRLLLHEPGKLTIGDGCLFGSDIDVTVSDMHSIVDRKTGRRVNWAADVSIGRRVWIGQRCLVLKGARIGEGAVVGAGSIVVGTREIPPYAVAAGNPARVIREDATWDFALLPDEGS